MIDCIERLLFDLYPFKYVFVRVCPSLAQRDRGFESQFHSSSDIYSRIPLQIYEAFNNNNYMIGQFQKSVTLLIMFYFDSVLTGLIFNNKPKNAEFNDILKLFSLWPMLKIL